MGSSPIRVANRYASVAQLVEQGTENPRVVGSIPTGGTISADLAHLVERHLAKVEVAGSSPVIRSIHGHEVSCPFFIQETARNDTKSRRIEKIGKGNDSEDGPPTQSNMAP